MDTVGPKQAVRLSDPQVNFCAENSQVPLLFLETRVGEHILEPILAQIVVRIAAQIKGLGELRPGPVNDEGCVYDNNGFPQVTPQQLLLPESCVVRATDLDITMLEIFVEPSNDEVEELAVELQAGALGRELNGELAVNRALEKHFIGVVVVVVTTVLVYEATSFVGARSTQCNRPRRRRKRDT